MLLHYLGLFFLRILYKERQLLIALALPFKQPQTFLHMLFQRIHISHIFRGVYPEEIWEDIWISGYNDFWPIFLHFRLLS